ncbi:MAG TPA: ABC transporter permease [Limnochordales bacterium]
MKTLSRRPAAAAAPAGSGVLAAALSAPIVRRSATPAVVAALVAVAIAAIFGPGTPWGEVSVFGLNAGARARWLLPDLVIPSAPAIYGCAVLSAAIGVAYLAWPGFKGGTAVALAVATLVAAFLVWAVQGQSLNLVGMLRSTLLRATPIALGALSGVLCERSGVINIAIEGMMLTAALTAVVASSATGSLLVGMVVAVATGALLALVHGVLSIRYRVDQIVSGTVINIFATGLTSYLSARFLERFAHLNRSGTLPVVRIPGLADIPILGPALFEQSLIVYIMLALVVAIHLLLFKSRFGLRMRAVGEHPRAADTLGIDVWRTRYLSVLLGGMVAGIGGAYFTIGSVGRFDEVMTGGRGFIGLAAMIFGNWTPGGAFASSLIFGFADSLQIRMQILQTPIPSEFLLMAPYVATMVALSGVVGRVVPPAADGQPYVK